MKLAVETRTLLGKSVKELRQAAKVPGVIYGRHLDTPISVVFDKVQLVKTVQKAGRSTPVELSGDGIDQLILFHDIQLHPVSDHLIHIDCLAVDKSEKTRAEVPVTLVGVSPFEKNSLGRVQLLKTSLEVEALPLDLPHHIEIDISGLEEEGQVLHVSDVVVGDKVEIMDDPALALLSTVAFKEEAEEEVVPEEGAEEGGENAEEGTDGE